MMYPLMFGSTATTVLLLVATTVHCTSNGTSTGNPNTGYTEKLHAHHYGPQPAMLPAVHWDTKMRNMSMLQPSSGVSLYYTKDGSADPKQEHDFAQVDSNMTHPTIILAHSAYIDKVTCAPNSIDIVCSNQSAYSYISNHWPSAPPFIVGTYSEGCGESSDQHSFWMVTNVSMSAKSNTVTLKTQPELSIAETFTEVAVSWGQYSPTSSSQTPKRDDSVPPPSSSGATNAGTPKSTPETGNDACGPAPSLLVDGFPSATCGSPTFDQDIDDQIGYLSFNQSAFSTSLQEFAPGLDDDYLPSDNNDFAPVGSPAGKAKRALGRLQRRGFFEKFGNGIKAKFQATVANAQQAVGAFVGKVTDAASELLALDRVASTVIPIAVGPKNDVNSVFGAAKSLFSRTSTTANSRSSINVYCVGCGIQGQLNLFGQLRYTLKNGLVQANLGLNGNIAAGLQIGIDANSNFAQTVRYPIVSAAAPPGFTIPKIFVIGPVVSLDVEAEFTLGASGQILAGATVSIPNFAANLDLVDGSRSATSGFNPVVKRVFNINANFAATAGLSLPLGVGLGVEIPPIKFRKTAAIYNKAYVAAYVIASNNNDASCKGVEYSLQVGNQLFADVFGIFKKTLVDYPFQLAGQCFALPGSGGSAGGKRALEARQDDPLSDITDNNPNNTDNTPHFNETSIQALAFADELNNALNVSGSYGVTSDDANATFVAINDVNSTYGLTSDYLTGNLYLTNNGSGSLFAVTSNSSAVVGDDNNRYAHYYPDTMAKYGVSRYRMSNYSLIPQDSQILALVPVNNNTVYAAFDTAGNTFLPVTCDIANQYSKIFMAKADQLLQGIQTLKDPKLRYTITGGIVQDCYYIPFAVST